MNADTICGDRLQAITEMYRRHNAQTSRVQSERPNLTQNRTLRGVDRDRRRARCPWKARCQRDLLVHLLG
jgi:hypothetical protein